jgi:hypothetical protein
VGVIPFTIEGLDHGLVAGEVQGTYRRLADGTYVPDGCHEPSLFTLDGGRVPRPEGDARLTSVH